MRAVSLLRVAMVVLPVAAAGYVGGVARAQTYPAKPVTVIVPVAPGTGNDVIARTIAQKVGESWTQPMVVENRTGASGAIAVEATAKAAPDGYTLVLASTSQLLNQFVSNVRYDFVRDFAGISLAGSLVYVLAVSNASAAKTLNELVAQAKSRPGKVNYAGQIGGVPQFMGEALKSARALDIVMIPYNSTTDALADVITGRVEIWFTTLASGLPQGKAGKVRILGVAGEKRSAMLPEVPTMTEAGFPELDVSVGFYILTAAATPRPVVNALNSQIVKALASKEVIDRLNAAGVEPKSSTPEALDALVRSEAARWGKIARESGIRTP